MMKKRLFSLALALALCLGLAVPATAASTSGLDAKGAQAFYNVLTAQAKNKFIGYADLKDMDGDGTVELVVVNEDGVIGIWQLKNGTAVQVADVETHAGSDSFMRYCTRGGKTYIHAGFYTGHWGIVFAGDSFIAVGGLYEDLAFHSEPDFANEVNIEEYSHTIGGKTTSITEAQYNQFLSAYTPDGDDGFLYGTAQAWVWEDYFDGEHSQHHKSYQAVLNQLSAKINASASTSSYGPYTIADQYFIITFSAAKAENATVQLRTQWVIDGKVQQTDPYKKQEAVLVTVKSGSNISISFSDDVYEGIGVQHTLKQDGPGKYTYTPAALSIGEDFNMAFLSRDSASLKQEIASGPISISAGDKYYILSFDTIGGFGDVKTGAYYAAPVLWALDKKITTGSTKTSFSPSKTCSVAEILTFLWRANGSPKQTGRNPFGDVSPSNYYYDAALWAYGKGLVSGNKLNPNTACTRAMTAAYLWKLAGTPGIPPAWADRNTFTDVPANASYAKAVAWAVYEGITTGTSTTTFSPNNTCTRGQIVTFLYRAMG